MPLTLASPAFAPGAAIPAEYTCDSADISPPLRWSGVPPGTGSLVLIVEDPDAPSGSFGHWAVYDIPLGVNGIAGGYSAARPVGRWREARNDFGRWGYGGPCPPPGGVHHYHFSLLAVSRSRLELSAAPDVADVLRAAQPYVIGQAALTGTYRR